MRKESVQVYRLVFVFTEQRFFLHNYTVPLERNYYLNYGVPLKRYHHRGGEQIF